MGLFLCAPLPNCDQPDVLGGSPGTICLGRHLVPATMHPGSTLVSRGQTLFRTEGKGLEYGHRAT